MSRFLGIDLGTSAVKVLVVDEAQTVRAQTTVPLVTQHPSALASEQNPEDWWHAVTTALDELAAEHPKDMAAVVAIGLSGQMHAALLLDKSDRPLRPAILWNDGRAHDEVGELSMLGPEIAAQLGVSAMAGFTAPKLLWIARHEPETFQRVAAVMLPKDFIRLQLTGERATDVSDAAGMWLLDEQRRDWSDPVLAAVGLDRGVLPQLVEGTTPTGTVHAKLAKRFRLPKGVVVAGGAGDTPAGGIGIGAVEEGRGFVSLGTSAQLFVATANYRPAPRWLVHAFCHGVPDRWYQMAAMLNGASVLSLVSRLVGEHDVGRALAEAETAFEGPSPVLMLPYLAGERTPHDDPYARGVLFGLSPATRRTDLVQAAVEGVAFTFADARDAFAAADTFPTALGFIGGGARSAFWGRIIASVLEIPLHRYTASDVGPAFGAARLARLALGKDAPADILAEPPIADVISPDPALTEAYLPRIAAFRHLYQTLRPEFRRRDT